MSEVILNVPPGKLKDIRQLYDKYAGMLLGYIRSTVQDQKRSEDYLIGIISAFAAENHDRPASWLTIRQFAQYKLVELSALDHVKGKVINIQENDYLNLLDREERGVFEAVYYQGRSLFQLADLLNRNENILRIQLKSSIDKIRKARGN